MSSSKHYRLAEIDLLRFLAALSVVFFHYVFRGHASDNLSPINLPELIPVFKYSYLGVNLFFMISGFVILMNAASKNGREFVVSRIVRLYPEFWICCTLTAIVIALWGAPHFQVSFPQYLINLTMMSNILGAEPLDGVYWTLFLEMKFYFLVFLLIVFKQQARSKRFFALWLLISYGLTLFPYKPANFIFMPKFSGYFIAGATFYLIYRQGTDFKKLGLLLGTVPLVLYHSYQLMLDGEQDYVTDYRFPIIAAAILVFYAIFFVIALNKRSFAENIAIQWKAWGCLTYSLYLIHQNVGYIIFYQLERYIPTYPLVFGTIAFMLGVAFGIDKAKTPVAEWMKIKLEGTSTKPLPETPAFSSSI